MDDDWRYVNKKPIKHHENEKNWIKLYDEYLGRYGLGEKFEKYLEALRKKALLQCDFIQSNDRFVLNKIEIQNEKIKSMSSHFGDGDGIDKWLIYLSKFMGYQLKIREITVVEYYELIEEYGKRSNKTE